MTFHQLLFAMGIARIAVGLSPFVAAGPMVKIFGFPAEQDHPTTRLMSRFFGVRAAGLGVLVLWALHHVAALPFILLFNACMDAGDLVAIAIPLLGRQGIDRAAVRSALFAGGAFAAWLTVYLIAR